MLKMGEHLSNRDIYYEELNNEKSSYIYSECPGIKGGCFGFRLNECLQDYTQCGLYQNAMNENNFEKNKK